MRGKTVFKEESGKDYKLYKYDYSEWRPHELCTGKWGKKIGHKIKKK